MSVTSGLVLAGSGFLLAVLWMDLIFDTQCARHRNRGEQLPEPVLSSISAYYHRATTTSQPMGRLIAVVMVVLLGALVAAAARDEGPGWLSAASGVLAGGPVVLALSRTVPNAVRLGRRDGDATEQSRLARAILRDHLVCFAAILLLLALWLAHLGR
ncbi:MAG TPA: hypothetical protein PL146_02890 [Mycobacterium sp.]|nr:hypothetical protein [Mycobacterium sp.]HNM93517.1 hypothetical protein [Mycobacterium sp.]